jgi:hypothetical protein
MLTDMRDLIRGNKGLFKALRTRETLCELKQVMKRYFKAHNESYVRNDHKGGRMLHITYPMSITNSAPKMTLPTTEDYRRMTLLA